MIKKDHLHLMNKFIIFFCIFLVACSGFSAELTQEMHSFAHKVARDGKISEKAVLSWMKRAEKTEDVIGYMDRQAESKPWKNYKPHFINDKKIRKGVAFKKRYPKTLAKAKRIYGVDPNVIVAILGVETDYGTYALSHRAMDALFTLAFYYPRRAEYFKNELEALMVYAYRNRLDPFNLKSSYAGAVGMPQFMPSNIMKYGQEFSGDGRINIFKSGADSIGSIANYLKAHGWKRDEPMALKVYTKGSLWKKYLNQGIKPKFTVAEMKKNGIRPSLRTDLNRKAALVSLEGDKGVEYWLLFNNFYAITRYNPSVKYALAVTILSKHIEIRSR
ncbi:MAG: lytic murein transglycosylase B [Denitrovibrio sp.]|nr:MAG: lytic murein transglycosylase B [Denitrovibrio sp.]